MEHFKDFVKGMDESVKTTISRFEEYWDKVARCKVLFLVPYHQLGINFLMSDFIFFSISQIANTYVQFFI